METQENENVISKEVAVQEMISFVKKWDDTTKADWEIEKEYPHVLEAIQSGLLVIDEDQKPLFKLKYPLVPDSGNKEMAVTDVNFRTRIRPNELAEITKGLNIGQQQIEYTLRCFSYITKLSKGELNKLAKFDYKVIEQLSTIFL